MKSIHILLVEDNEGDIYLIREAFEKIRLVNELSVLTDGEKAIEFLEKKGRFNDAERPDLIILDVNLPRKNGHEVLRFIKNDNRLKLIPVIILTTSSAKKDIKRSYENYANCYITKPVEIDDFLNTILSIEDFWINLVQLPKNQLSNE